MIAHRGAVWWAPPGTVVRRDAAQPAQWQSGRPPPAFAVTELAEAGRPQMRPAGHHVRPYSPW